MDEESKYCSNLERVYVHEVYEKISSKYDELLNLSQRSAFERLHIWHDHSENDPNKQIDSPSNTAESLREAFKDSKNNKLNSADLNGSLNDDFKTPSAFKCNIWPKVKKFLLNIEPYSLIGKNYIQIFIRYNFSVFINA
jgi:hypothetical protein